MRKKFSAVAERANVPRLPDNLLHLWRWYVDLSGGRSDGFSGPGAITYPDIYAWSCLTGVQPSPTETRLLLTTDGAWRGEWHRLHEMMRPKNPGN